MKSRVFHSLLGGALPAVLGVIATLILTSQAAHDPRVAILFIWTVLGYLSLTDFGLTRAASKLSSSLAAPRDEIVPSLWRASAPFGLVSVAVLVTIGLATGNVALALTLLPVPLIAAFQFPLMGLLEAGAQFGYLAVHRTVTAVTSYLLPAILVSFFPEQVLVAAAFITASRLILFLVLCRRLHIGLTSTLTRAARHRPNRGSHTRSVVSWLAISSVLGPLLLYADRIALALFDGTDSEWVYYVALSELLMRSYLIPTAVVAVLFPWLSANASSLPPRTRRLFELHLPGLTLPTALMLGAIIGIFTPDSLLLLLGASAEWMSTAKFVLGLGTASTLLSWATQAHIAVLHALDAHRFVGAFQMITAVPFLAAICIAAMAGGVNAVAVVVFLRVFATWAAVVLRGRRALRSADRDLDPS